MKAVDVQPWDPSVKALTQFPSVLDNMAKNLSWTSSLGEAYSTQAGDVMTAVQTLRAKAYASGNLKSGSQITVVQQSPQTIVIQPTNPQVVYVPVYNPTVVYGTPYTTPGYSTGAVVATGLLAFGAGIAVGAAISGGCCGWGYSYWGCNWHGGAVVYGGGAYYGNAAWHGGYYGSSVSAYGPNGSAHYSQGYNPSTGNICARRVGIDAVRNLGRRTGLQPEYRSVCCDPSDLECQWKLRQLGRLEKRQYCVHPASDDGERVGGKRADVEWRPGLRCDRQERQQRGGWRIGEREQIRNGERQPIQEHRERLGEKRQRKLEQRAEAQLRQLWVQFG